MCHWCSQIAGLAYECNRNTTYLFPALRGTQRNPPSPTRTFLFPDSSAPLSSCLSHTFLCPVYPDRTLSRSGVKMGDLWRCGGANKEDRLEAASATSHQIGGIKWRNPFADGRWWEPTGIKGVGEAATPLRADGGLIVLWAQERRSRNVSGSRRGSDSTHTHDTKDSAFTSEQWSLQACGA